jgi:ubiquinone/menaquinone biosynthesis C-methylase UbiE/uncharacterized protein YbaR (Trm112 family)
MHKRLVDFLFCPNCHGILKWKIEEETDDGCIYSAIAICTVCEGRYQVREGVGVFVKEGTKDPWRELYSELKEFMETEGGKEFLTIPFNELNPADRLFQSYMLEINGDLERAKKAEDSAMSEIYSEDYKKCWNGQIQHISRALSNKQEEEIIVDLASGRGILGESVAKSTKAYLIMSDISPYILERDKKVLDKDSVNENIDYLAFDIRSMPFRNHSISTITTNLGFQNVSDKYGQVDSVFDELKRVLSGVFLGVANFYPPSGSINSEKISELGLGWSFYKDDFLRKFRGKGFEVGLENACKGRNDPTPSGHYIKDAFIDSLPIESTYTEWYTVTARIK